MKEHTYKYKWDKMFVKSLLTSILLGVQMCISIFMFLGEARIGGIILLNLFFGAFTIPGLVIHFNHWKYSQNVEVILRYDTISLIGPARDVILNTSDITQVILHQSPSGSRFPWWGYSWFELIDKDGQKIKVSCYLLDISEFWTDTLSRKVNSKNLVRKESFFPLMN